VSQESESRLLSARDQFAAAAADWENRDCRDNLASRDLGRLRIKETCKSAQDAAFRLSAKAEQNEVMAR